MTTLTEDELREHEENIAKRSFGLGITLEWWLYVEFVKNSRRLFDLEKQQPETDERRLLRELGEWLAAAPKRYFSEYPPEIMAPIGARSRYNWTIKLTENGTDVGFSDKPDRLEAIRDAIQKATRET